MNKIKTYVEKAKMQSDKFYITFNERAGIMEFDGGLLRKDAERLAYYETLKLYGGSEK